MSYRSDIVQDGCISHCTKQAEEVLETTQVQLLPVYPVPEKQTVVHARPVRLTDWLLDNNNIFVLACTLLITCVYKVRSFAPVDDIPLSTLN
jgi:hypothetical protein